MIDTRKADGTMTFLPGTRRTIAVVAAVAGPVVLGVLLTTWLPAGSPRVHAFMEAIGAVLALVAGLVAVVTFVLFRSNALLFTAAAFVGVAVLDAHHAVLTGDAVSSWVAVSPDRLLPWSWMASRVFLAAMVLLGLRSAWIRVEQPGRQTRVVALTTVAVVGLGALVVWVPLPPGYQPFVGFGRPYELAVAALFLVALVRLARHGGWRHDAYGQAVLLALIINTLAQVLMARSSALFDSAFVAAHLVKIVSYATVLAGLLVLVANRYRDVQHQAASREQFFASSLDLLCLADLDGYFVELNPMWSRTLGWSERELRARPYIEFVHPSDRESTLREAAKLAQGHEVISFENRYQTKDGGYRWLLWSSSVDPDAGLLYAAARDMTEHKQLLHETSEREGRLQAVLDATVDGIITITELGSIESFNRGAEAIFGYRADEIIGQNVNVLMPEPYHGDHDAYLARYLQTGDPRIIGAARELQAVRRDGTPFDIYLAVSEVELPGGRRLFSGVVRDISARKAAERALQVSEDRFRDLFESAHDLIQAVDPEGRFVYANPAWHRVLGYAPEELPTLRFSDVVHPDSLPHCQQVFRDLMGDGAEREVEAVFVARDRSAIHVEGTVGLHQSADGTTSTRGMFKDVTARKEAEAIVERAKEDLERRVRERTRELEEAISLLREETEERKRIEAQLTARTEWMIRQQTNLAELIRQLQGLELDEALPHIIQSTQRVVDVEHVEVWILDASGQQLQCRAFHADSPDSPPPAAEPSETRKEYLRALRGDRVLSAPDALSDPRLRELASTYLTPLGIQAALHAPVRLRKDLAGVVRLGDTNGIRVWSAEEREFVASIADLVSVELETSELKAAEDGLRALNERLDARVRERTAALEKEKERAEAADKVKSAFLATMSHELRTPLNSILGFTGILLQGLPGALNEEQDRQLGMVQRSARHLLNLINDVLDISKIEAGELDVVFEECDVRLAVEHVITAVKPLAEQANLDLTWRVDPEAGSIVTDPRRFEQILLNLLSNAVKFTERGEVILTGSVDNGSIRVAVRDTGIGMAPHELERLFVAFRQLDQTRTRQREGTGLGLAISRRLAQLLGGDITVESTAGIGSTFTLEVPAHRPTELSG